MRIAGLCADAVLTASVTCRDMLAVAAPPERAPDPPGGGTSRAGHLRMAARGDRAGRGRGAAASTIVAELRGSVGHAPPINLYYPGVGGLLLRVPPVFRFLVFPSFSGRDGAFDFQREIRLREVDAPEVARESGLRVIA